MLSDKGNVSAMRVMALMCCIAAIVIAIIGLNKPVVDYSGLTLLVSAFLGAGFTGKVIQKQLESKQD